MAVSGVAFHKGAYGALFKVRCMVAVLVMGIMFRNTDNLTASTLLLFIYVGSLYLTEIRPLQELGTNFANVLSAVTKTDEILNIPIYEGGVEFPEKHDIELRDVQFSYMGFVL